MSLSEAVRELRESAGKWRELAGENPLTARAYRDWAGVLESRADSLEWEAITTR